MFDLDPAGEDFAPVRDAALGLQQLLDELELPSLLMATGSRGLHVVVALDRRTPFDDVRAFARDVADVLAARHPDRFTTEPRKKARRGRLYLDIGRNAYAQTAVAPYAVRARPGAPSRPRSPGANSTIRTSPPAAGPSPPSTACSRKTPGRTLPGPAPSEGPAASSPP